MSSPLLAVTNKGLLGMIFCILVIAFAISKMLERLSGRTTTKKFSIENKQPAQDTLSQFWKPDPEPEGARLALEPRHAIDFTKHVDFKLAESLTRNYFYSGKAIRVPHHATMAHRAMDPQRKRYVLTATPTLPHL